MNCGAMNELEGNKGTPQQKEDGEDLPLGLFFVLNAILVQQQNFIYGNLDRFSFFFKREGRLCKL